MLLMTASILPSLKRSPNATPRPTLTTAKACSFHRGHQSEFSVLQVVIKQRPLGIAFSPLRMLVHLGIDMAVDDQQILPAIIVVVEEAIAEADKGNGRLGDAGLVAHVGKIPVTVVLEQNVIVVGKVGVDDIETAVVQVIAGGNAHVRNLAPALVERIAAHIAVVLEGSIALVDVEIVGRGVISHQQVGLAIVIHVGKERAQSVISVGIVYPSFLLTSVKVPLPLL